MQESPETIQAANEEKSGFQQAIDDLSDGMDSTRDKILLYNLALAYNFVLDHSLTEKGYVPETIKAATAGFIQMHRQIAECLSDHTIAGDMARAVNLRMVAWNRDLMQQPDAEYAPGIQNKNALYSLEEYEEMAQKIVALLPLYEEVSKEMAAAKTSPVKARGLGLKEDE